MIVLRKKLPYIMTFCLFVFAIPTAYRFIFHIFPALRWTVYLGFIVLGFLYNQTTRVRKIMPSDMLVAFFVIILFASYGVSIMPNLTLRRGIAIVLMYSALFFGLYSYIDNVDKISKILHSLLIFMIIYDVLSLIPGVGMVVYAGRLGGLSKYPGETGAMNVFILPIALMEYLNKRKKINLFIVFVIITVIYLTYARAAFIALVLAVILFYGQYFRSRKIIFVFIALLTIGTILISFFVFGIWLPERLVRIESLPILGGRVEAWRAARDIIAKRPLYGFGFGTEEFLSSHFDIRFERHAGGYFHNSILGLATQIGIPASLLFFAIIIFYTFSTVTFAGNIENINLRLIGITLGTILFIGFMYCFSESWIYSAGNVLSFIYFTTVVLALRFRKLVQE